jgi:hypothetical protein
MPLQLLLAVILFGFTLWTGNIAWEHAKINEEKVSCYKTLNTFLVKSQLVLSGAPGSRERVNIVIEGRSRVTLSNEEINGSTFGVIKAEFPDGSQYLQILPVPIAEEKRFLAGEYRLSLVHERGPEGDFLSVME